MNYCKRCVLSDNIPSVVIGSNEICNYCGSYQRETINAASIDLLEKYKGKAEYDVLLAYSGGKDSTYTLCILREKYNLRVLTMTFDNGFLSPETFANIRGITEKLDSDNIIISPSKTKIMNIFRAALRDKSLPPKALERASSVCTYCIALVKSAAYREAILRSIPLIAFGWTPGQISMNKQFVKLEHSMVISSFNAIRKKITNEFGTDYESLFFSEKLLIDNKDHMPVLFYPFPEGRYDEREILQKISGYGWIKPAYVDENSTNCLINSFAIKRHIDTYGFHPYAMEVAHLVRSNVITREEGLRRIRPIDDNNSMINKINELLN